MHNNNLEGGTEVNIKSHNKGTIVVVSYDKQGQMVMKENVGGKILFFQG